MRRRNGMAALLFLATALLVGCNQSGENTSPKPDTTGGANTAPVKQKGVIGVSLLTLDNPFFKVMGDAMTAEGDKNGYKVLIVSGDKDPAKQKDQVNDFIAKKVNAIILCPCDARSIGTSVEAANKAGIPVFTADTASLDTSGKVVAHIATDNYAGGKLAGQAMIDALSGKGKVAIIDFPEAESVIQRTKGFKEVLAGAKGLKIVAQLPGGADRDKSYAVAQDILEKNPDLAGIFCINDPTAFGAVAALEKTGRTGKVKIVSFDGQPEAKQAVKDGKIYAEPIQYPDKIGILTVQTIVKYMAGDKVDAQTLIPTTLYKKADADADTTLK